MFHNLFRWSNYIDNLKITSLINLPTGFYYALNFRQTLFTYLIRSIRQNIRHGFPNITFFTSININLNNNVPILCIKYLIYVPILQVKFVMIVIKFNEMINLRENK